MDEIIKIKAEIFDIIAKQEQLQIVFNNLHQEKAKKLEMLKELMTKKDSVT